MNYLQQIETEFSRGRGKSSVLSPLDWQVAENWETDGIPLRIVLSAMGEGFKNFTSNNRKGEISSIRYFIPMVNQQFAEWQSSQIGKSPETPIFRKTEFDEEKIMQNSSFAAMTAVTSENIEILDVIVTSLMPYHFDRANITLPEPLRVTVAKLRSEILALMDEAGQKQISSDAIETRLTALRLNFELTLLVSVSDDELAQFNTETKAEYGKYTLLPDVERRVLIRKLYRKFGLPEITLFAL